MNRICSGFDANDAFCRDCGEPRWPESTRCLRCERMDRDDFKNLRVDPMIDRESIDSTAFGSRNRQITIGSVMLVTALCAICLGIYRIDPRIGLIVLIAATYAFLKTIACAIRANNRGRRVSAFDKIDVFLLSFVLSLSATIVAFVFGLFATLIISFNYYRTM